MAVALHLDADEPKVQAAALKCLQAFKHKYLNPHLERLLRYEFRSTSMCLCVDMVVSFHERGLTFSIGIIFAEQLKKASCTQSQRVLFESDGHFKSKV